MRVLVAIVNFIDGKPGEAEEDGAFMFFGLMFVYVLFALAGLYVFLQDGRMVELFWRSVR